MSRRLSTIRNRPPGRTGQVYEALKEQVLDQTIKPGGRINIDQLVIELGVSSTPIREALAKLASERLVAFEPYIGYSAAPIHDDAWFHDMIDLRKLLEGESARLGAPRRDASILAELEQAFADMSASGLGQHYRKYARHNAADARFHEAIVASSQNRVFAEIYVTTQPHVHYARLYLSRGAEEDALVSAEHHAILQAFREGDGESAAAALVRHLEAARARLLKSAAIARARVGEAGPPKKRQHKD